MMRKLAVTVFALSLAALGCGSDSGTKPVDTGVAAEAGKTDTGVTPVADAPATPDVFVGGEVQAPLDTQKVEAPVPDAPVLLDQALPLDTAPLDGPKGPDLQGIDGPKPLLDSGADAPKADAGPAVDAGSVDGGTVG